jgi:hypothetical protein
METGTPMDRGRPEPTALTLVVGAIVGAVLAAGGLGLAVLAIASPLLTRLVPGSPASPAVAPLYYAAAGAVVLAPMVFLAVGIRRLVLVASAARHLLARPSDLRRALDASYAVALDVPVFDGWRIPAVVVGPFGAAVIREVPAGRLRHHGRSWELRLNDGHWIWTEDPRERTVRDAHLVRRWLTADRDFVVAVHPVVVTSDPTISRTSGCAVVRPEGLSAWLAALPHQRGLTPQRRELLAAALRAAASPGGVRPA